MFRSYIFRGLLVLDFSLDSFYLDPERETSLKTFLLFSVLIEYI